MGGTCSMHGRDENAYSILVGKPEVKRPLGRPRHKGKNNIRMDLRKTRCEVMNWIHVIQDRDQWRALVNTAIKLRVP